MTTILQLDWMQHSLDLTADILGMDLNVAERIYSRDQLAALKTFYHDKQAVLTALRLGRPIPAELKAIADYLTTYADAHLDLYGKDSPMFYQVMAEARHRLNTPPADKESEEKAG